jgi:hypothetical protein
MTDSFEEIQQMIQQLLPIVLLGPGVVLVGIGLFMWLGGLRWLKAIAAFTLATIGFTAAWHLTDRQIVPMVLFPIIAAGFGLFFHKLIVVILGGCLAAAVVLAIPAAGEFKLQTVQPTQQQRQQSGQLGQLDLMQSIERLEAQVRFTIDQIVAYGKSIPKQRISLAFMVALGVMGFGFFSWRMVCAVTCATFGTCLIGSGMSLLLLYKGDGPIRLIAENGRLVTLGAVGMIAVGTIAELLLCPKKNKKKDSLQEIMNQGDE